MYVYDVEDLLARREALRLSLHALLEAYKEGLRGKDVIYAILKGRIIERYPERDRVLISGATTRRRLPLHVVCDYSDDRVIVAVTAYIPDRSEWAADVIRRNDALGRS